MQQRISSGGYDEEIQEYPDQDDFLDRVDRLRALERYIRQHRKKISFFFKSAHTCHLCFSVDAQGQSQQVQPELHGEDGAGAAAAPLLPPAGQV